MTGEMMNKKSHSGVIRQSLSVCLLVGGILAVLLAGVWAMDVQAQDGGPVCPPGFTFDRLSGVGCVQDDCFAYGHWSYTGSCICAEGYVGCYEPVDYEAFDPVQCHPFCPNSSLVSCIQPPQVCAETEAMASAEEVEESSGILFPKLNQEMLQRVQNFLTGGNNQKPTARSAAVAALAGTSLLGSWAVANWLNEMDLGGIADEFSDQITDLISETGKSIQEMFKQEKKAVKKQVIKTSGEKLAEKSSDILDRMSRGEIFDEAVEGSILGIDAGKKTEAKPGEKPPPDEKKELSPEEELEQNLEELLKAEKEAKAAKATKKIPKTKSSKPVGIEDIPRAKESSPVKTKTINPKSRVFDGDEAMIILKELDKLSQNISKKDKMKVKRSDLDGFTGTHPDGEPRKITMPGGKTIIVTKVEAIGFEGEEDVPDGSGPRRIDFSKSLVITAELVEEAADQVGSGPAPSGKPASGTPSQGTSPGISPATQPASGGQRAPQPPSPISGGQGGTPPPVSEDPPPPPPPPPVPPRDKKSVDLNDPVDPLVQEGGDQDLDPWQRPSKPGKTEADMISDDGLDDPLEDF